MEFPQTTLLRTLIAEHGAVVVETVDAPFFVEFVLDECANDPGCPFRTEADVVAPLVGELVHLLADDVAGLSDRAFEEGGLFEQGGFDVVETVPFGDSGGSLEKILEAFKFGIEDIVHSAQ